MSFEKTWSGDWRNRILERVTALGAESVTAFASLHAGEPLSQLAERLGVQDVAEAQIQELLVEEAAERGTVGRAVRDLLARGLRAALPHGWHSPLDENARFDVAAVFSILSSELDAYFDGDATVDVARRFLDETLPSGWRPTGPDDPVIVRLAAGCLRAQS